MNPEVFDRPTYSALISLLDNYEKYQGIQEDITSTEVQENSDFLDSILATSVGQRLYEFLDSKGEK